MSTATKVQVTTYPVEINAKDYELEDDHITLVQIRQLGNIPADHKVYHEDPNPKDDPEVTATDRIKLHRHKPQKFYSVSPAISGGRG